MPLNTRSAGACRSGAFVLGLTVLLLQGCGGSGGDSTANANQGSSPPPPGATNHAPTITGSPAAQVQAGSAYNFTPSASDADGDALSFSIANGPSWGTFDPTTGRLTGTPSASNVGTLANIVITVSDGVTQTELAPFSITVAAASATVGSAMLSWNPPTTRVDGTTLTDLAGYTIKYGNSPESLTTTVQVQNAGLTTYTIDNLSAGTYYFEVLAIDAAGVESQASGTVSKTI